MDGMFVLPARPIAISERIGPVLNRRAMLGMPNSFKKHDQDT